MRRDAKAPRGKTLFTITIEFPNGQTITDEHVYKVESELWLDGRQCLITYHDTGTPNNHPLIDGTMLKFTEENVNEH